MGSLLDWFKAMLELRARHIFALIIVGFGVLLFASLFGKQLGVPLPDSVRLICIYATVVLLLWGLAAWAFSLGEKVSDKRHSKKGEVTSLKAAREALQELPPEALVWVTVCAKHNRKSLWARMDDPGIAYLAQKGWFEAGEMPGRMAPGLDIVHLLTFTDVAWQVIDEERVGLAKAMEEAKERPVLRQIIEGCESRLIGWSLSRQDY